MTEFQSIREKKQWENLLKVFGNTENGRQMARLVMRAQNGQITEEEKSTYVRKIEEDLALIRAELVEGCIPPIDHIITHEENERLKQDLIEKENLQLIEYRAKLLEEESTND